MRDIRNYLDKIVNPFFGGIFGILSITSGIIGDTIAFIFFPEYNMTKKAVSYLCKGPGGIFFQIGAVFSGIFAILFLLSLANSFLRKDSNERFIKIFIFVSIVSCTSLIFLGIFCGSNPIIALLHGIFAFISWFFGLLYITLLNILILKDSKYSNFLAYIGFFLSWSLVLLLTIFLLHFHAPFHILVLILPSLEWFNTILIIVWYFIVSVHMIYSKI
jgi:hypothetical protein